MPGETPSETPGAAGQVDYQQIITAVVEEVGKTLDTRVSGLQSSFQRMVNEAVAEVQYRDVPDDDPTSKPLGRMSPSERALKAREDAVAERELAATKAEIAAEYKVKPEELTGNTREQLEISALKLTRNNEAPSPAGEETPQEKPKSPPPPAPTGSPVGTGDFENMTPTQIIAEGLKAQT